MVVGVKCKIGREEIVSGVKKNKRRNKFHYALELKLPKRRRVKLARSQLQSKSPSHLGKDIKKFVKTSSCILMSKSPPRVSKFK